MFKLCKCKKKMKYIKRNDGEEFAVEGTQYIACCDCGLVHRIKIRKHKGRFYIRFWRDNKRTTQKRSRNRKEKH